MRTYKIIGDDQKEHGPVSEEPIRQWLREGRVNSQTSPQAEGVAERKRSAGMPTFVPGLSAAAPATCTHCGEPFVEGFDSCWNCGTRKDGSRPKEWASVADDAMPEAGPCPRCGSHKVRPGKLLPADGGTSVLFKPEGTHFALLRFLSGVLLSADGSFACLDCGLVWDSVRPGELKEFISKRCGESAEQDAYALLAEAGKLESLGDTSGALAKYQAVREKFSGTGAAKDAEFSIRNLLEK